MTNIYSLLEKATQLATVAFLLCGLLEPVGLHELKRGEPEFRTYRGSLSGAELGEAEGIQKSETLSSESPLNGHGHGDCH